MTGSLAIDDDLLALAASARGWCDSTIDAAARRTGIDDTPPAVPDHWSARVELGRPGLVVPEDHGGSGAGLDALAVVLEETGRAAVPGPLLPTALAAAIIDRLGDTSIRRSVLPRLVAGTTGTVAFAAAPLPAERRDGRVHVTGSVGTVLAASADVVIVPAVLDRVDGWIVVGADRVTPSEPSGVDLLRPVADVAVDARVEPSAFLADPGGVGGSLAALLLSAEAVGLAAWCVDTAAVHAADRVQFGRPIGQFQGVKHRCADMLARLELARAAVWDAARGGTGDEERLAVGCAAAIAPGAAVDIAKDTIQVLGGIGFTYEHDAHLYLRRAVATRSMLPSVHRWRATVVGLVNDGVTRALPVELPASADAARGEVAAWLAELTERPRQEWNTAIADDGYLAPHWPAPWGRDADAVEQLVIDQEFRRAGVRRPHLQVAAWALPTIIAHGTPEQQQRWVGPSLRLEIRWCQLFSEPEAGSDLASLRTRAVRDGDGWRLTGQKVWTSMAESADWGICLARTSPDRPKHDGITCFVVDMATSGIDVRPLREINGDAWFNEVFFDDVFVPDDCVVGAVDDGWRAGRTTLANERVSMGGGASIGAGTAALLELLGDDPDSHHCSLVGDLLARDAALGALRTRMTLRALAGADAGPEASVVKLLGVIHDQDVQEAGVELLGPAGAAASGPAAGWVHGFLWNRSLTIAGGTSEVQRNVIAERLLGLPRDP